MARFRCRACGREDTFVYQGRHECPSCGSIDVQFALGVDELTDDDPLIEAMKRLAENHGESSERTAASRFRCAACGQAGKHRWDPDPQAHACPVCGSPDVVFTVSALEIPDELVEVLLDAEPADADASEDGS